MGNLWTGKAADVCGMAGWAQRSLRVSLEGSLLREQVMGGQPGTPLSPKNAEEQAERDEDEIAEVEMILETYFMHVDNTFNKLQTLCEYIDDTEVGRLTREILHGSAAGDGFMAFCCAARRTTSTSSWTTTATSSSGWGPGCTSLATLCTWGD
jgi:hypothetical protein